MILIVTGGRDYRLTGEDLAWLEGLVRRLGVTEMVHGGARGVDSDAGAWAAGLGLKVTPFPVPPWQWQSEGKKAGPMRNARMAEYAREIGALAVFPGGTGTASMVREAQRARLAIYRRMG